jgi:hypothetical protein
LAAVWEKNVMKSHEKGLRFFLTVLAIAIFTTSALAETIYVDGRSGIDKNPGTKDNPVRTVGRAAEIVNGSTEPGPVIIKIAPGVYSLSESVEFNRARPYTENGSRH